MDNGHQRQHTRSPMNEIAQLFTIIIIIVPALVTARLTRNVGASDEGLLPVLGHRERVATMPRPILAILVAAALTAGCAAEASTAEAPSAADDFHLSVSADAMLRQQERLDAIEVTLVQITEQITHATRTILQSTSDAVVNIYERLVDQITDTGSAYTLQIIEAIAENSFSLLDALFRLFGVEPPSRA